MLRFIGFLLIMTPACHAACDVQTYAEMFANYNSLKTRVEKAYDKDLISQNKYEFFQSTLQILAGYLQSFYYVITTPPTQQSPDTDQCESMEMQVNDVIVGFKGALDAEIPFEDPNAPLAPSREARGPSAPGGIPKDVVPHDSSPYVETPQQSVQTDIPPTPPMGIQKEPKPTTPSY